MKILVLFYSTWGHMYRMAKAAAEGAAAVDGAEVRLMRIPETLSREVLDKIGAVEAQKTFADVPVAAPADLEGIDGLIVGVSTRYGMMTAQMKTFLDATGFIWVKNGLMDKPIAVVSSTAQQHGGNEVSILTTYAAFMHHGMIPVGLPYAFPGQTGHDQVRGGSPYGASTIAGGQGDRWPSEDELAGARYQGRRLAVIAKKLAS
jgi:NAD(P)H dehydrogenase (quinone)